MVRYLLLLALTTWCSCLLAQTDYQVLEDDPNYAQFMYQVSFGFETDFAQRSEVPLIFDLHYDLESIPLEFETSFLTSLFSERKQFYNSNQSDNEFQKYSSFEVGGVFNFFDKTKLKLVNVPLRSDVKRTSSTTKTTNYYLKADGTVRNRLGLRTGVYRFAQSLIAFDAVNQSIGFSNGTAFPDPETPWDRQPSTDDKFFFTAERHLAAYIGLVFHSSTGLTINTGGYGKRDNIINLFIYADLLMNLDSDIQKLGYQEQLYDLNEAESGVDFNDRGFRIGAKLVDAWYFVAIELGQRPHYFQSQYYTQFSLGYSFNRNL